MKDRVVLYADGGSVGKPKKFTTLPKKDKGPEKEDAAYIKNIVLQPTV